MPAGIGGTGAGIAADALQYVGVPYRYSGANPSGWDCSGFVNWVLGHDLQMVLPGSVKPGFNGKMHGPVVVSYSTWGKATTVKTPEANDLCIWVGLGPAGHIGIATSNTHMISALNPALGTIETPIQGQGPAGAPLIFRRVTGSVGSPIGLSGCNPVGMILCLSIIRKLLLRS
jgi:peptidoglycan DL-endopeptidase CwlO